MFDEELEQLIKEDIPSIPKMEYDSKKLLQECIIKGQKRKKALRRYVYSLCSCVVICLITVFAVVALYNKPFKTENPLVAFNVDRGKNSYLAKEGLDKKLYEAAKLNDPDWEPIFDRLIAFGPELSYGTIKTEVIVKSDLLNEENKKTLYQYETDIKKRYPSHTVAFQIGLGIKDNKDYIYLVDYCGYDKRLGVEVINKFFFPSNLNYSFNSIVEEFESMIGTDLTDEFLNSAYYDSQNLLSSGIILGFFEIDGLYKEYYVLKFDGKVYAANI